MVLSNRVSSVEAALNTRMTNLETMMQTLSAQAATFNDKTMTALENENTRISALQESQARLANNVGELHDENVSLNEAVKVALADLASEKATLLNSLQSEFEKHKLALQAVVGQAHDTFGKLRLDMANLTDHTGTAFQEVKAKVEQIEAAGGALQGHTGDAFMSASARVEALEARGGESTACGRGPPGHARKGEYARGIWWEVWQHPQRA